MWMWGKRLTFSWLVELQIGAATLKSSVENPQRTWNGPTFDPEFPFYLNLLLGSYKLANEWYSM